jgi:uncharacterized protein (TIGR02391 family)
MQTAPATDLLSVETAAAEYRVHRTTIYRAIKEGLLHRNKSVGDRRTFVDRWELQRLVDPPAVTRCMAMAYSHFTATAEWPQASELQRQLVREGDSFDLISALEALPNDIGWRVRDAEGRVRLTVRGVARCPGSAADIDNFLGFVRLCFDRYLGTDPEPTITSDEVRAELRIDLAAYRRLHQLIELEGALYGGGGGNNDNFKWVISDRIRHFRDVKTIHQYLAVRDRLFGGQPTSTAQWSTSVPALLGRVRIAAPTNPSPPSRTSANDATRFQGLHPAIQKASLRLYSSGHYSQAVLEAAKAVEEIARSVPALSTFSGRQLVEQTFAILPVADPTTRTGRGVQEGLRSLAVGAFMAFRNPAAHELIQITEAEAIEILGIFSLLARRLTAVIAPSKASAAKTRARK